MIMRDMKYLKYAFLEITWQYINTMFLEYLAFKVFFRNMVFYFF